MASQVANLLTSLVGPVTKPQPIIALDRGDAGFSRLLDAAAPAPAKNDRPAPATPAANDTAPKPDAAADKTAKATDSAKTESAAETSTDEDDNDTSTGENTLADSLLAALAALGLTNDQAGAAVSDDPAALAEVEGALNDLAKQLGMDLKNLMQQLAELAKGVAASGGKDDLAAKLQAFAGEKLGAGALDPAIAENLNKLMGGLEKLAKAIPTEPELATPALKLEEPVLTGKTQASEEKPELPAAEATAKPARKDEAKPTDAAPNDKAPAQTHAARNNAPTEQQVTAAPQQHAPADPAAAQVNAASTPRVVQTGYQTSQQQLNLPQIAFELSRQVGDGNSRFQIRLDPPELGRIEVKLDIDNKGQVHAKLTVEKAETLDLMQRDQRALERALQQAGLDSAKTNLEFSLKQNPFAGDQNQRSGSEQGGSGGGQDGQEETEVAAPPITLYRGALQASGVNIIA